MTRRCPMCGSQTDSLKAYRLPTFVLFLGVAASFRHGQVVACPTCMRRELTKIALINVLPANVLWLLLLAPWYSIAALRSTTHGHSEGLPELPASPGYREPMRPAGTPDSGGDDEIEAVFVMPHRGQIERIRVASLRPESGCYRAVLAATSAYEPGLYTGLEVLVRPSTTHGPLVWVPPIAAKNLETWSARCDACGFDLMYVPAFEIAKAQFPQVVAGQEPSRLTTTCPACGGVMHADRITVPTPTPRRGLGVRAQRRWLGATVAAMFVAGAAVGAAAYGSESDGVAMSFPAAFVVGFVLGTSVSIPYARARNWSPVATLGIGLLVAFAFVALAGVFFAAIFPAL